MVTTYKKHSTQLTPQFSIQEWLLVFAVFTIYDKIVLFKKKKEGGKKENQILVVGLTCVTWNRPRCIL